MLHATHNLSRQRDPVSIQILGSRFYFKTSHPPTNKNQAFHLSAVGKGLKRKRHDYYLQNHEEGKAEKDERKDEDDARREEGALHGGGASSSGPAPFQAEAFADAVFRVPETRAFAGAVPADVGERYSR